MNGNLLKTNILKGLWVAWAVLSAFGFYLFVLLPYGGGRDPLAFAAYTLECLAVSGAVFVGLLVVTIVRRSNRR